MLKLKQVSVFMWPLYPGSHVNSAGYAFSPAAAIGLGHGSVPDLWDEDAELYLAARGHLSTVAWVLPMTKLEPLTVSP